MWKYNQFRLKINYIDQHFEIKKKKIFIANISGYDNVQANKILIIKEFSISKKD